MGNALGSPENSTASIASGRSRGTVCLHVDRLPAILYRKSGCRDRGIRAGA
jgi:hypothetical protein